ncbi:MAG: hypothetical protein ACR2PH_11755 [Desulfobulbia bacterium]
MNLAERESLAFEALTKVEQYVCIKLIELGVIVRPSQYKAYPFDSWPK